MREVGYNDENLRRLFAEMDTKLRAKALRGAFTRQANQVRRTAVTNLRTKLHSNKDLEKGLRKEVFKRVAGFRVTISAHGDKGLHTNRRGLKKPVLIWAEEGTKQRRTKTKTRIFRRSRRGHPTGRMGRYAFMQQTKDQVKAGVTNSLREELTRSVIKTARKYGCN